MKGTLPGILAAFLTLVALFALAGYQITTSKPATRLLSRQAAAMIEVDRWLPAHREDLELLARDRSDGVIAVRDLPIPVTLQSALVLSGDQEAIRRGIVFTMGTALYNEGPDAFRDSEGNSRKPGMEEPIRWSAELLGKSSNSTWQVALVVTALLMVATLAAVMMANGDPITPIGAGAAFSAVLAAGVWFLASAAKGMSSAPVDQEIMLALRDGAWIGIRNGAALAVAMIGIKILLNTFAGRDRDSYQQRGWQDPDGRSV